MYLLATYQSMYLNVVNKIWRNYEFHRFELMSANFFIND